jgi:hypothetical protein
MSTATPVPPVTVTSDEAVDAGTIYIGHEEYTVLSDYDFIQRTKESLDESYPPFVIGYSSFYAGDILEKLDPISWRIMLSEESDNLEEEQNTLVQGYTLQDALNRAWREGVPVCLEEDETA